MLKQESQSTFGFVTNSLNNNPTPLHIHTHNPNNLVV